MKFLIDAQISPLLCDILKQKGYDTKHVRELMIGTLTSDSIIMDSADQENRVMITKDYDFYYAHFMYKKPSKLLLITLGNTKNRILFDSIRDNIALIESLFENYDFLELNSEGVVIREI
ncbi:DUF5615 family PIN-like protein [Mucilaginibacter arboris]|uniref:DUF5615 domain-containing protein n=1 Tax=Mucilaginibacter arboris TaxID=2682090 RepID=A0A7K1SUQ4_9SPHI|nr:DUF5615 family PIN-like protein [Mucilaginibacter arboris]MVN21055.1 hypothetical protein [Mucilaginibacter arboris]